MSQDAYIQIMELLSSNQSLNWEKLIDAALEIIKPQLRHMSLRPIGEIEVGAKTQHTIHSDDPFLRSNCPKINLRTRAFFSRDSHNSLIADPKYSSGGLESSYDLWAITHDAKLLTIEIFCKVNEHARTEDAVTVYIHHHDSTDEFLKACGSNQILPMFIWSRIVQVLKKHTENRQKLWVDAEHLSIRFGMFNELICARFRQ